jgi:hypothetical protein
MLRVNLAAGETLEIPANGNIYTNVALISGEINYRIGNNTFNDATDLKLTDDIRTDSVFVGGDQRSVFVKAIQPSVIQYRRE